MTRAQLEHLIRAAAVIADDDELIIVGSQSILGAFPDAPAVLLVSDEADVYPKNHPERSDLIDGSIGELSPFHDAFGYYAQGVGENTAILPAGWRERLVAVSTPATRGATGWCLEPNDLALAKLAAGRDKDLRFVRHLAEHAMIDRTVLEQRLPTMSLDAQLRHTVAARISGLPAK